MNEPAIEMQAVYKSFRSSDVLRGTTLRVEGGRTFAFLGRNAAGKTTTIRLLLGLLKRDDGAIRVLGLDPQREPIELRRRIGYLAEDQTMYGWMRVEEIVRFVAPFYPTWDHDLAFKYIRDFELPARTRIKHLSKGQNVRLGLVLALAHRPELVILDDPALGLDPIMRKQFQSRPGHAFARRGPHNFLQLAFVVRSRAGGRRGGHLARGADRAAG